jgi:tetratricopeptide (TPR) repeat protein
VTDAFRLDPAAWAQLRMLLDEALALPAADRPAWLARLDDRHAALRPRLQALLAHAADDGVAGASPAAAVRLLDALPVMGATQGGAPADTAGLPGECAGDAVGPYRLIRELGSGGMGSVWLAERTDLLQGRQVALKLPHGAWRRAGLAERLAREREILATLEHPNIARLYEAGVAPDGQPWLALEHVDGRRIDAYCLERGLPLAERLRLFLQVARAVAHAHAQLVVHRDLKPANILVTHAGDVKLLDFGIAKLLDAGVAEETALTREAGRALTPEYASPEQILGRPLGTASDVYSLGVVLFELLTDARPYRLGRATRVALEDAIVQAHVPRPSSVAPPGRRRALRGDLDTIVLKALRREPAERYPTVAALAEDVQRHLERRPVLARPDRAAYRLRTFVLRHRMAVGAGTAVVAALAVGLVGALWQAQLARAEQRRAEAVKAFVTGLIVDVDPFSTTTQAPTVEGLLQMAEQRLRGAYLRDPAIRVELLQTVGASLIGLSRFERAEAVLRQAVAEGRDALGPDHPLTLQARLTMLDVHRFRGRVAEMQAELDALLPALRADPAAPPEQLQRALTARAHLDLDTGRYAAAATAASEALGLAVARLGDEHPHSGQAALLLATAASFGDDDERALELMLQARDRLLRIHGSERPHAGVLEARFGVGRALGNVGRYAEAVDELHEVLQQVQTLLGGQAHMAAFVATDLARFELELGRPGPAAAAMTQAMAILQRETAQDSYTVAAARGQHGLALLALGRHDAARQQLARAGEDMARMHGPQHPQTLGLAAAHAAALARLGRLDEAWQALQPQLAAYRQASPGTRYRGLHAAGLVRRLQGYTDEARDLQAEALAALPDTPLHRPRRDTVHAELARLALGGGDARAALEQLQQLARAPGAGGAHGPQEAERWAVLGQAQLAVGRIDEGRAALAEAERLRWGAVEVGGSAADTPGTPATATAAAAKTAKTAAVGAIAPAPGAARAATPLK